MNLSGCEPIERRSGAPVRPAVRGKFVFVGEKKFYVKGVTYGAFKPDATGNEYHDLAKIGRDFAQMAAAGINTVRIPHTMPPRALLDVAQQHGLLVMVGLSAEQYVGFLIDRGKKAPDIGAIVREKVRTVAGHPALLCYGIGNEISAPVARWLGARRIERYLHRIHRAIKAEDAAGIVTYVNYPTTEYLSLPFLDAVCFNVYLETPETLQSYLMRLHNIAGDRPLIMSEVGLDSLRNGEAKQAEVLEWQIRIAFEKGCAGAIVFSWTDEWFRADEFVEDWAFGLTTRDRRPRPALAAVEKAFHQVPFANSEAMPRFSVLVCTYNGARTIRDCLEALKRIDYPDFEVIVVNDGSTDATAKIVEEFPEARLISTENFGLSHARNVAFKAATGELVAYIDDDAYPDSHWLQYLARSFGESQHVGIGGPNIEPADDGFVAECVANAPGGPIHVLLTDEIAEHIPGCNMAFRKSALEEIGGFDENLRVAGDDVDLCWRLQQQGATLGFSPAAVVWHHRRNTVSGYLKQQRGYGRAEALLEAKWPEKYNAAGHCTLMGRIYGKGFAHLLGRGSRIYHGVWGTAPFQSLYQRGPGTLLSLPTMPEWYLIILFLAGCAALSVSWPPMYAAFPLLGLALSLTVVQAWRGALNASFTDSDPGAATRFRLRALTALLHLLQPLARLNGRIKYGLTLWRSRGRASFILPWTRQSALWTKDWVAPETRLAGVAQSLQAERAMGIAGNEYVRWDLEVRGGMFGAARLLMAIEDHGGGCQYVRTKIWPRIRKGGLVALAILTALAALAAYDCAWTAAVVLGSAAAVLASWVIKQAGSATSALLSATADLRPKP